MARLTPEQQDYIVRALACFDSPSQIVESIRERFGITISRQLVATYDPETKTGRKVSPKHRAIFAAARAEFLGTVEAIPIAHLSVRLSRLQRLCDAAQASGNGRLLMAVLEQAAREVGGAYTNRRELTGRDGGAVKTSSTAAAPAASAISPGDARSVYQHFAASAAHTH